MGGKRAKRWKIVLLSAGVPIAIALAIALAVLRSPPGPVKIEISPGTTFIDGPLNPDGTVNYVAALDAEFAAGITTENNAAPLLLKALGPGMLEKETRAEVLDRLGLTEAEIAGGPHFVAWEQRKRLPETQRSEPPPQTQVTSTASVAAAGSYDVCRMLCEGVVHPDLEGWLDTNKEAMRLVGEAAKKPRFYVPLVSRSNPPILLDVTDPPVKEFKYLPEAFSARALLKMRKLDVAGAWDDVMVLHRLARLVQQVPTSMHQLMAMVIEARAADTGIILATRYPPQPAKARELLQELAGFPPVGRLVETVDRTERFKMLDVVMRISRGEMLPDEQRENLRKGAGLDWNQMLRRANDLYNRQVAALRTPRLQGGIEAERALGDELRGRGSWASIYTGTAKAIMLGIIGGSPLRKALSEIVMDCVIVLTFSSHDERRAEQEHARMAFEIERTAIALAWFRAEKGLWPGSLAELCPGYLPSIPSDPFSPRGALIYRTEGSGYILYSVGKNLRDDGGVSNERGGSKDDIVAKVVSWP